ncbi:MAG: winged helix-turn-helix transcriptional regulator [Clostridia bacterium]|nr:winged helix-turn-helix transcriptional regulator [Clostridia bacterium]
MKHISGYISVLHRFALQFYNRFEKETGIRSVQYPYLFYIGRHEGCRQEELVKHLHVNKSNVTRQLDKLQQGGFIDIRPDESDGRGNRVYLTDKAGDTRQKVSGVLSEWNEILCRGLDEQEAEQLKFLLDKALKGVKEWDDQ